ncbi:MAG TPA: hypothetical protein PKV88_03450 [Bacteroidales bacterium]|nr:hypothetical protein [Bacteroidales bacterium]
MGERAPELVVDGPTLRNIQMNAPEIIQAIHAMRVPQFATGNISQPSATSLPSLAATSAVQDPRMDVMITLLQQILEENRKPTRAMITYQDIKDADEEINDIKNSVKK